MSSLPPPRPLTYAASGVDIEAGDEAVRRIRGMVARTHGPEVLGGIGSFGGLYALGGHGLTDPVLVSGTDGVGTKLRVAFLADRHDTIGIDGVAMCVNDVLCQGARPLFFLDYVGTGALVPGRIEQIVSGVVAGCEQAGCALVGGETAELPGIYGPGEYDLVGFTVGIVDRSRMLDATLARPGDVLIGMLSSGLHSNGYSLARKVVFDVAGLGIGDQLPGCGGTVADVLLEPTRIYVRPVVELLARHEVHGLAHITGGGLPGNVNRALPADTEAVIDLTAWTAPPVFQFLAEHGPVERDEMLRTFNMGIGMVAVLPRPEVAGALALLSEHGVACAEIGVVRSGSGPARVAFTEG